MTNSFRSSPADLEIRSPRPDDVLPTDVAAPAPDQDSPGWRRSLVALEAGQVVGAGEIVLAPVSDMYLLDAYVAAGHRRRGVGSALVAALSSLADQPFPRCGRAIASQPWRRAFVDALGCEVRVRYPGPWIDPTSEPGKAWAEDRPVPPGYVLRSLAEIEPTQVAEAWLGYSTWAHRPFGGARPDRVRAEWPPFADRLDPHSSVVAVDATGAVVAFSLVTPDAWLGRTFVVAETVSEQQPDGDAVLGATVAASLRALDARGVRLVELEGHSTDPHLPALAASLPPGGADPMEIVELVGHPSEARLAG